MTKYAYEYEELKIKLTVGGKSFEHLVPNFEMISSRGVPVRILSFEVGNVKSPAQGGIYTGTVKEGDPVELVWGLADAPATVFKGKITSVYNTRTVMAMAKDDGALLMSTITTTNTRNEKTSQIVKRLASEAGVNPGKVTTNFDVTFPHFCALGLTAHAALQELKQSLSDSFGLDVSDLSWWVDGDGVFHFGTYADKANGQNVCKKPLEINNERNLIELEAPEVDGDTGRVLTHAWPYFDHSQPITITDKRLAQISGKMFRTESVRHIQQGRKARSEVFFREL